jgi:class 3 adenylate cyclase/predicted ATPase/tetratricopeptide (TPR) repeat protein
VTAVNVPSLPTGTVTFLFFDIEGSSQLWERYPEEMKVALARHDALLCQIVENHGGSVVKTTGDGAYVVFAAATNALASVVAFQQALAADTWPELAPNKLRARAGLHTGEAELREGDYHGPTLNRAARIMSSGHGGQILLSMATASLVREGLPDGITLRDLGEHRLRGLARPEQIFQVVVAGLPDEFPPLTTESARPVNLPQPPTGFIGRWQEVDEILQLLAVDGTRLVTLVGPGGMGKTRLGIQAAATLAEREPDRFPHGIYFVPLVPVLTAETMVGAVAAAIGFQFNPGERDPRRQLVDYLRRREALIILDNMEHLLEAQGAALPAEILANAPGIYLLATSRARLGIHGEHLYHVPGMDFPDLSDPRAWPDNHDEAGATSGLRLFLQAARQVRQDFRLDRDNIIDVSRIGRLVQGMPLGIELAAGWLEILSPGEIAAEIERSLDVLATDLSDVPERQRSMRAVFDTTWAISTSREQALLPMLAIFRSPFIQEAAGAVAGAGLRDLMALAGKSWLQRVTGPDGTSRFQMHELLRQFAEEKSRADEKALRDTRRRLIDYFADLLAGSVSDLKSAAQFSTRDRLTADFDNIALAWILAVEDGDFESVAGRMMLPLYYYGLVRRGLFTIDEMIEGAIAARLASTADPAHDEYLAVLRVARACRVLDEWRSDLIAHEIMAAWNYVLRLLDPLPVLGYWYIRLCGMAGLIDQMPEGRRRVADLMAKLEVDDTSGLLDEARLMMGQVLAFTAKDPASLAEAERHLLRAYEGFKHLGNAGYQADTCQQLAVIAMKKRDYDRALAYLSEAQVLLAVFSPAAGGWLLVTKGEVRFRQGDIAGRFADLAEQARIGRDQGDLALETHALSYESIHALRFSTIDHARRVRREVVDLSRAGGGRPNEWHDYEWGEIARVEGDLATARRYYETAASRFRHHGETMGIAFCERGLGDVALAEGEPEKALAHFRQALAAILRDTFWWAEARTLAGLSRAAGALGHDEEAVDALAGALRITDANNELDLATLALLALAERVLNRDRPDLTATLAGTLAATHYTWNEVRAQMEPVAGRARALLGDTAYEQNEARGRVIDLADLVSGLAAISATETAAWLDDAERLIDGLLEGQQAEGSTPA